MVNITPDCQVSSQTVKGTGTITLRIAVPTSDWKPNT